MEKLMLKVIRHVKAYHVEYAVLLLLICYMIVGSMEYADAVR